jgi:hypothetical protein
MIRTLSILFVLLWVIGGARSAWGEVIEYKLGDTITVPCPVNQAGRIEAIRSVVLLGVTKATIKGTWSTDDCDVLLNGNVVRVALLRNASVPIGVLADNGLYYHIVVKPAQGSAPLSPVITVVPAAVASDKDDAGTKSETADIVGRAGGSWEHETNLVLKLQKHIRGGRHLATVSGVPRYNAQILREEGRRVPGFIWTESDDWKVVEYYEWTLDRVHAHYIGVTYTGRFDEQDFNYEQEKTDDAIAIWHQPAPGDRQFYTVKLPVVRLKQGREEFFIEFTVDPTGR